MYEDEISLTHADDNHDIGRRCGIFSCRVPNNDACFVVSCLLKNVRPRVPSMLLAAVLLGGLYVNHFPE